jgi:hypothetical protein
VQTDSLQAVGEARFEAGRPPAFIQGKETKMTADSLQKQSQVPAGQLFQKGQSGNPSGRRPGCRNRATLAAEVLLEAALRGEPAEVREVHMKRDAARYGVDPAKLVK